MSFESWWLDILGDPAASTALATHLDAYSITKLATPPAIGGTTPAAITGSSVKVKGTVGGLSLLAAEGTVTITATHTKTIALQIPTGSILLGCQLKVETGLTAGETWNAAYATGNAQTIVHEGAVALGTKLDVPYEGLITGATLAAQGAWASRITTAATDIAITKHSNPGVDNFTALGAIRAIVYYLGTTAT
jgi:hypothetical protein